VSDVSAPACTNGVWPPLRPVNVVHGAAEQTVNHVVLQCPIHQPPNGLHGLTMRQPNGCSKHAPKSSAAKQWIKELAQTKEEVGWALGGCEIPNFCKQILLTCHLYFILRLVERELLCHTLYRKQEHGVADVKQ